ncbi:unnamed protein product [Ceutorhynchus assimilis]|uniref:Lipase domain-containing protein n=1 Tax=Ceutorhynchus assimilis TaxID=467358 RepID=A0A9N9MPG3_9CUCU|nr:unnamed protein product [Ceutorhynchus assimilis]
MKEKDPMKDSESDGLTTTMTNTLNFGEFFSKCFDGLGCVKVDESWYDKKIRPVNLKPFEREIINTEFILVMRNSTHKNKNEIYYQVLTTDGMALQNAGYIQGKFLFILLHDFTSNGYTGWIKHITKVLKSRTVECNVISVDWHAGSEPPYDQAIANARVVALEVTHFLKFLRESHNVTLEQVHLIGHGVGAHIAGYVGHELKVKKISGLDPSGPRFDGMPAQVKLDATDADYVEVLHTDVGARCSTKQSDVLSLTRSGLNKGEIIPGCSHKRAFKYYIESLEIEDCTFLGIKCGSYLEFKQGKCTDCGENCRTFGLVTYSKRNNGSYFLQTNSKKPYCLFQYRVNVHIGAKKPDYFGSFEFFLMDQNYRSTKSSMLEHRGFKPGKENSFVFYATVPEMGKIVNAKVGWIEGSRVGWSEGKISLCLINCKRVIDVERLTIQSINSNTIYAQEVALCPDEGITEIQSGDFQEFSVC